VHARGQVVHLDTAVRLPAGRVHLALNAWLPEELAVLAAVEVPAGFHARDSAVAKTYLYRLTLSPVRPVLQAGRTAWERRPLDLEAMRQAAGHLVGRHDFAAFCAAGATTRSTVRRLEAIHLLPRRDGLLLFFRGEGFLYRMVRNLVGTLLEVGRGRRDPEWAAAVLESRDRRRAGPTAPAAGLYMWRVHYRPDPFAGYWRRARTAMLSHPAAPSGQGTPGVLRDLPMKIEITSRSDRLSPALRDYAGERLGALERLGEAFRLGEVILDRENDETVCEMILHRHRGEPFVARAVAKESRAAVDEAVEKLERQYLRFKEIHSAKGRRHRAAHDENLPR